MKIKLMIATGLTLLVTSCASEPKNEEFKTGIGDCAMTCKTNPEIKEYSQETGGGIILLFLGHDEKKCICNR